MKKITLYCVLILQIFYFNCGTAIGGNIGLNNNEKDPDKNNLLLGIVALTSTGTGTGTGTGTETGTVFGVSSTVPSSTESDVSTLPVLSVVFNENLDTSTITTSNVILLDGVTPVSIQINSASAKTILFSPISNLKTYTTYTAKLTTNVKNTDGDSLSSEYKWSFTTYGSDPDSGSVSTLAGDGTAGNVNGTGTSSRFSSPQHLVMDIGESNLLVTDTGNHNIRKVTASSGIVTTIAGSTAGTSGYTTGTGTAARFNSPKGIFAMNVAGVLYYFISDSGNNGIRRMTAAYAVTNSFGTSANTAGFVISNSTTAQRYRNPEGFVEDYFTGNQYTVDTGNHCIRKSSAAGTGISTSSPNTSCFAGASPSGGLGTSGFTDGANTSARFNNPKGIAVDTAGNLFVADSGNHSIRMISPAGLVTTIAGNGSAGYVNGNGVSAQFSSPVGIASDGGFNLYVTDSGNCSVRKIVLNSSKTSATVSTYAGANTDVTSGNCGFVNDTRLKSRLNSPKGIWRASNGIIYVTDTGNHAIRKIIE